MSPGLPRPGWLKGLRRQASLRLLLVMISAAAVISSVAYNNYLTILEQEIRLKEGSLRQHYQNYLPRVEELWRTEAERSRARMEFSRIIETPDPMRWAKLTAFLNAQWQFLQFPNMIILGPAGEVLFRYGPVSQPLDAARLRNDTAWHYDSHTQELYRIFLTPVWLGQEGQGTLALIKSIDQGTLAELSVPDSQIELRLGDRILAQHRSPGLEARLKEDPGLHQQHWLQVDLPWPGPHAEALQVRVRQPLEQILPLRAYIVRPLMVLSLLIVLLVLGLGLWLSRTIRRIEALRAATLAYGARLGAAKATEILTPALEAEDEIRHLGVAMRDMMQEAHAREQEQQIYLETLALLEEAVLELDDRGQILRASPGWHKLVHRDDSVGMAIQEFIHPDDADAMRAQCKALGSGEKHQAILRVRLQPGGGELERWVECRLICHQDNDGRPTGLRGVLRDITQTYLQERQITHMALHDALTHLPNRVLLEDRIDVALRMAARTGNKVGICFIDLDHFKNVNDALGHKAGDRILVAFAERLRSSLRAGDTLARWGGDEFVLLLPDVASEADIREVTGKISQAMQTPISLDDTDFVVTFSLGAAVYPDNAASSEALLSQADRAMFFAKAQGRNQICFFSDITHKANGREELYLQNLLANAIHNQRIEPWFQPIVAGQDGRCIAVEVLARWHEPGMGWIGPSTFIPMAENLGLIRDLGDQVWRASLDACRAWRDQGFHLQVAINISKRQLFQLGFTEKLLSDLAERGLPAQTIILEVTESVALLDVENAGERLIELDQAGFHIAIDDFGTGYASLSQLHEMPVDELKIDMSFVRRINDPKGHSMIQTIITLARSLGLKTIAEGVEDADTAARLTVLGVDALQGYHFAPPMPREELERWLLDQPRGAASPSA